MNPDQARNLVRQTLAESFDKGRFLNFMRNLLNHIDEAKASQWNTTYIKDAFKDHVHRYERLGTYTSPDKEELDILIVHLTAESKLERTRTAIRNFVADYLDKRGQKDAALVAFVSPTEKQWRFSYVKMEYATVEKESGKIGVETRLTPARRFSYIVGEGESCHTAQTRFVDLLQDTETDPALVDLEEAFSVEAVTKEFFTKYAELFGDIHRTLEKLATNDKTVRNEFKEKNVNAVDFAKKLMGQIVFLYFLQKKGWLGVTKGQDWGTGPHDFLRQLARGDHGEYTNFFNDILEPFFYDTLATDRGHEAWCTRFKCRIPFLNGGLFEPLGDYNWRKTDILLPNCLFTNTERVEEGIAGTGILDVFDRYNFTVNEAEPLEKEVAIDPEMLGKVFENLIEENRRRGLGAYYTPREIVHYMCQESLINYLATAINKGEEIVLRKDIETFVHLGEQISHYEAVETKYSIKMPPSIEKHARLIDEKLADITICDPAVGSGAFPVGMMTEIVRARSSLTPYFNDVPERTPYHFKRHAIQNCLYGVDIDAGAVEIAKLRLWLSLVVDEEDVKQIKPLPNLDYKIVAGNSLLSVEKTLFNDNLFQQLEKLKPRYFNEGDKKKKTDYRNEIDNLIAQLTDGKRFFDFEIYFSEVFHARGGFDVVIGNPPYIRIQTLSQQDKKLVEFLKTHYESARKGNYDLYVVFVERGLKLLQPNGHFAFILPHKFLNAQYGQPLRALIAKGRHLRHVVHFGDQQIFPGATNYVCLLFLAKAGTDECRWVRTDDLPAWLASRRAPETNLPAARVTAAEWNFAIGQSAGLFERLQRMAVKLRDVARIFQGLVTGSDKIFALDLLGKSKSGIAKVQDFEGKEWEIEAAVLRRFLHDVSLAPYVEPKANRRLLFPYSFATGQAELIPSKKLASDYPLAWAYLRAHSKTLRGRERGKWDHSEWYAFGRNQNMMQMEAPKLVVQVIAVSARYAYDAHSLYFTGGGNGPYYGVRWASPNDLRSLHYLQALLNSRLLDFFLQKVSSPFHGGYWSYGKRFIEQLPIAPVNFSEGAERAAHDALAGLAKRVLAAKSADSGADTLALEQEIDQMVYQLYRLTPKEIAIIEKSQTENNAPVLQNER